MKDPIKFLNLSGQIILLIYVSIFYFIQNIRTGSGAHPASHSRGKGVLFWRYSDRSVQLTTHLNLVPKLRMSGVTLPLPLHAFIGRTEKIFTFTFPSYFAFIKVVLCFVKTVRRGIKVACYIECKVDQRSSVQLHRRT
jgi:hypothetical protein